MPAWEGKVHHIIGRLVIFLPYYRPSLKHQRPQPERQKTYDDMNAWYTRGQVQGSRVTKFRNGACENCGSMTHKKKDCLEVEINGYINKVLNKHFSLRFNFHECMEINLALIKYGIQEEVITIK